MFPTRGDNHTKKHFAKADHHTHLFAKLATASLVRAGRHRAREAAQGGSAQHTGQSARQVLKQPRVLWHIGLLVHLWVFPSNAGLAQQGGAACSRICRTYIKTGDIAASCHKSNGSDIVAFALSHDPLHVVPPAAIKPLKIRWTFNTNYICKDAHFPHTSKPLMFTCHARPQ